MKIIGNWKLFIVVLNVVIVLGMIGAVIYATTYDFELVDKDYYTKGLKYQQQINKQNRANALSQNISLSQGKQEVVVYFPKLFNFKKVDGSIEFYRPNSAAKDFRVPITLDSIGIQKVSFAGREKGAWVVKVDWKDTDSSYFYEEEILVR